MKDLITHFLITFVAVNVLMFALLYTLVPKIDLLIIPIVAFIMGIFSVLHHLLQDTSNINSSELNRKK
jgi:hypothetical protein